MAERKLHRIVPELINLPDCLLFETVIDVKGKTSSVPHQVYIPLYKF